MSRLTTNKPTYEMTMLELAYNSCYCKDGVARYRDFENDMDARDLARKLAWSLTDIELSRDNECFDEEMIENLQYNITKEPIGLIALFYRNLWAMADLRERLKEYEDAEEQGLLLRLPCKVGDTVYYISEGFIELCTVEVIFLADYTDKDGNISYMAEIHFDREDCPYVSTEIYFADIGKTVFLTQAEAEQKLKEMESD